MTPFLTANEVEQVFVAACHDELTALKPGNVHIHASGHGMDTKDFEKAAAAAAPFVANPDSTVGKRIVEAARASFDATNCNTNLGIILLASPLAYAATTAISGKTLRQRLTTTLNALTIEDANQAFAAITYVNPGGLGHHPDQDVSRPATETLKNAMARAAGRDRIARAYTTGFADIFEVGLPFLSTTRQHPGINPSYVITTLHMSYLARWPDSHIGRKYGEKAALALKDRIGRLRHLFDPIATPESSSELLALDGDLKREGLNPGTTADLVVATLFAERLIEMISAPKFA